MKPITSSVSSDWQAREYTCAPSGKKHEIIEIERDIGSLDSTPVFAVMEGSYFAMGDNRDNTLGGRVPLSGPVRGIGSVPARNLVCMPELLYDTDDGSSVRFNRMFATVE